MASARLCCSRKRLPTKRRSSGKWAPEGGFTLLELVLAVTLLAVFILPMLYMVADSRVRAMRYTIQRQVRGLAQEKLHDRIHYYIVEDTGTFEEDGHMNWTWEIDPPEMQSSGEQALLTYTIRVSVPQKLEDGATNDGEGSVYEYSLWTFPDEKWYEEQEFLYENNQYSPLYGDPNY